ncbi:hypothetical protein C0J52_26146 [Blattella germanica]|nr:hypothetical protein C0J52_26146 [Blattella germanica]
MNPVNPRELLTVVGSVDLSVSSEVSGLSGSHFGGVSRNAVDDGGDTGDGAYVVGGGVGVVVDGGGNDVIVGGGSSSSGGGIVGGEVGGLGGGDFGGVSHGLGQHMAVGVVAVVLRLGESHTNGHYAEEGDLQPTTQQNSRLS